ncbi:MAG: hypothetical protein WC943_02840 [Elusimicrobiota bacterium]|jgi:hypothetical protein
MKAVRPALLAVLLLASVPAAAVRPLTPPAPEIPEGRAWVNARPLTMKLLRGRKVALVAFLNMANINSLRTLSVVKEWWERYALEGLMVIGVQSPEYDFQKDPLLLQRGVKRLGVTFPVVIDADRSLWKGYAVEGWPALYLVDHQGRIVYDRIGEGRYEEFEGEIRAAAEAAGYRPDRARPAVEDTPMVECGTASEAIFAGSARGSPVQVEDLMRRRNTVFINVREREAAYQGEWKVEPEALLMAKNNKGRSYQASFVYRGARVLALLGPGARTQRFHILQDERWIRPEHAGRDIRFDEEGESFVEVDEPRMYDLIRNPTDDLHEIFIVPSRAGGEIYELDFSDRCLAGAL